MKKLTVEQFIEKAIKIHGNKYDYSQIKYINYRSFVIIKCNKCGNVFKQTPANHLQGKGCKACANNNMHLKFKEDITTFIKKAKKIHSNKYDYSQVDYINRKTPVLLKCNSCGTTFWQLPLVHLLGCGCLKCKGIIKYDTLNKVESKARKIHGNKYKYLAIIPGKRTKIKIYCKTCNKTFIQRLSHHLQGHGCLYCGNRAKGTTNDFIKKAKNIHKDRYDYSQVVYVGAETKVNIFCIKCKRIFKQTPSNHLHGRGCPYCKQSKGELSIAEYLDKYKIKYITQYRFKDCKDKRPLPFDFYLPDFNCCIEYQGQQHYNNTYHNWKKDPIKNFERQQYHDKIKKKFCKSNQICLLEIKYDEDIEKKLNEFFKNK